MRVSTSLVVSDWPHVWSLRLASARSAVTPRWRPDVITWPDRSPALTNGAF